MKFSKQQVRINITGYSFISLNLLGFLAFTALPVIFSLIISFSEWDYTRGFSGIQFNWGKNYVDIWKDEWFLASLKNTVLFAAIVVPMTIVLSLGIAVLIDRFVIGKISARLALFIPYISNIVAVSIVWVMMYSPYGPITRLVMAFGVKEPPKWLADYTWALPALMLMGIWGGIGYAVMIYSAAIQSLPEELYEAAIIDGASELKMFSKITVPLLSPTTFFLVVTNLIGAFQVFAQVQVMTRGGPGTATHVLVYYIYTTAFTFFKMGYAATISWVLFAIIFIVTIFQWKGQKKWVDYM